MPADLQEAGDDAEALLQAIGYAAFACRKDFVCSNSRPSGDVKPPRLCHQQSHTQALPPTPVVCRRVAGFKRTARQSRASSQRAIPRSCHASLRASSIRPTRSSSIPPPRSRSGIPFAASFRTPLPRTLFASIGYVSQPKADTRNGYFVRAEVAGGRLGVEAHSPSQRCCTRLFLLLQSPVPWMRGADLFDLLRTSPSASATDLRLALKVRMLEFQD